MNPRPDVLIVGAGPTGLTLACELARRDISVRLIEASIGSQVGSRGKGLQPRTLEVFDALGIIDQILAKGRMGMPVISTGFDGRRVKKNDGRPHERPDVPYPASVITPQWLVEEALRDRLDFLGGTIEFATELKSFAQSDGLVSASLARADSTETVTIRWLVGCDGGQSTVRKQAGIDFTGETFEDIRMMVADIEVDGLDRSAWQMWRHNEGFAALCPLPSTNLFQFQASIAHGQNADLSIENIRNILNRRSGDENLIPRNLAWSSLWRANVRIVDRYREGNILLAGDAAHVHSPAGGQGMNTGIQDAYNLGWKLAAAIKHGTPALLDTYETERRPVALDVLALSNTRLNQALEQKTIPVQRDASVSQFGVSYRGSSLTRDDRDATYVIRAGDRAPDAPGLKTVLGTVRLFDLLRGTSFVLLQFGRADDTLGSHVDLRCLRVVEEATGGDEVVDVKGFLSEAYQASENTLILIRPDGYIGAISDRGDTSVVQDYLAGFCLKEVGSQPRVTHD